MDLKIRKRQPEDSLELAHCIATVWNTTYKGIVDDEFLRGLLENEKDSAERLKNSIEKQPNYYVMTLKDRIIGWIYFTLDSDTIEDAAEIHSLYVLKEYQNRGYGKMLYDHAVKIILQSGLYKLIIRCLEGNPSNEFYRHMGGHQIGKDLFRDEYPENIYLFEI